MITEQDFDTNFPLRERIEQEVFRQADIMLGSVGLSLNDLRRYGQVLDLGAGLCQIERAAIQSGQSNICSAGLVRPREFNGSGLKYHQFDIEHGIGDLSARDFDLIVSLKGPMSLSRNSEQAVRMLENTLLLLGENGELRLNPVRFGFVKNEMFNQFSEYGIAHGKPREQRSKTEIEKLIVWNSEANRRTIERLRNLAYVFSVHNANPNGLSLDNQQYLVFKKSENDRQ